MSQVSVQDPSNSTRRPSATSVTEDIVGSVEEDIVLGRLHPRERLVEEDLIERFDCKRHVVRQALFQLESIGLVERIRNRGAFVKAYTPEEVEQLYAMREILELAGVDALPLPAPEQWLSELEDIHQRYSAAVDAHDLTGIPSQYRLSPHPVRGDRQSLPLRNHQRVRPEGPRHSFYRHRRQPQPVPRAPRASGDERGDPPTGPPRTARAMPSAPAALQESLPRAASFQSLGADIHRRRPWQPPRTGRQKPRKPVWQVGGVTSSLLAGALGDLPGLTDMIFEKVAGIVNTPVQRQHAQLAVLGIEAVTNLRVARCQTTTSRSPIWRTTRVFLAPRSFRPLSP